jgi:hypothetical protein
MTVRLRSAVRAAFGDGAASGPSGLRIDTWHVQHSEHARNRVRGFLLWAMTSKLTRHLRLPAPSVNRNAPLPQLERLALLGRLLTAHDLPLRSRVAGLMVLLYAQLPTA